MEKNRLGLALLLIVMGAMVVGAQEEEVTNYLVASDNALRVFNESFEGAHIAFDEWNSSMEITNETLISQLQEIIENLSVANSTLSKNIPPKDCVDLHTHTIWMFSSFSRFLREEIKIVQGEGNVISAELWGDSFNFWKQCVLRDRKILSLEMGVK